MDLKSTHYIDVNSGFVINFCAAYLVKTHNHLISSNAMYFEN